VCGFGIAVFANTGSRILRS